MASRTFRSTQMRGLFLAVAIIAGVAIVAFCAIGAIVIYHSIDMNYKLKKGLEDLRELRELFPKKRDIQRMSQGIQEANHRVGEKEANYYVALMLVGAKKYGIDDPRKLWALAKAESCFNRDAESCKGAQGLYQVMTFHYSNRDIRVPHVNTDLGARIFARALTRSKGSLYGAAVIYNSGGPRYKESIRFAERVVRFYAEVI